MDVADFVVRFARELGRRCPEDIGVIGVPYLDEIHDECEGVDTIEFERMEALNEAIDLATKDTWSGVRRWLAPRLVKRGTVRASGDRPGGEERSA